MPVLAWFIFCTLSRRRVRLPVNSVNTDATPCQLSQCRVRFHVTWVNAEGTNIYKFFINLRWLSWRGVFLRIDSVNVESYLALTQLTGNETLGHRWILKYFNKLANSRTKSKAFKSLIIWPFYVWSVHKTRTEKSHESVHLKWQIFSSP